MKSKLIDLIKSSKKSSKELSALSGVSYRTIEQWLYSGIMPTLDNAEKVLKGLGYEIVIKKPEEGQ